MAASSDKLPEAAVQRLPKTDGWREGRREGGRKRDPGAHEKTHATLGENIFEDNRWDVFLFE